MEMPEHVLSGPRGHSQSRPRSGQDPTAPSQCPDQLRERSGGVDWVPRRLNGGPNVFIVTPDRCVFAVMYRVDAGLFVRDDLLGARSDR